MNWVNKHNFPTVKAVKHNSRLCLEIKDLWHALHSVFNTAQNYQIDNDILCYDLDSVLSKRHTCYNSKFLELG